MKKIIVKFIFATLLLALTYSYGYARGANTSPIIFSLSSHESPSTPTN
jgi:hypothetical protein